MRKPVISMESFTYPKDILISKIACNFRLDYRVERFMRRLA